MSDTDTIVRVARAICRERCAFLGEPPCFDPQFKDEADDLGLSPHCDDPGCEALAKAAVAAITQEKRDE